jgi:hypothetical protein
MALTNKLTAIGDAIRAKTGESELLTLDEMAAEIAEIPAPAPGSDTYRNYATNGLTTISQDVDWPVVRNSGFSNCVIKAKLNNMTSIGDSGFYNCKINVPQDFSKVTSLGVQSFYGATFTVPDDQDTTFSFDSLPSILVRSMFSGAKVTINNATGNVVNVTFDFPRLTATTINGREMFSNFSADNAYIQSVTLKFPVLTTISGSGDFQGLGAAFTTGTEYIINLPELTNISYNATSYSGGIFAASSYNKYRPLRIRAPKLATTKNYMFYRAYLRELVLDWDNISSISGNAFVGANYEGMFPALPSVTNLDPIAFENASANLQDTSTTPYVWKIGSAEPVLAGNRSFNSFSLYNYDGTLRPVVLDFPSGLTDTSFARQAAFKSTAYTSPISIVIRNSTVPTLSYSPTASNGIFGGALQPGQQVYVPRALLEDYKAATNWSVIASNIVAIEDYPDLLDQ